MKGGLHNPLLRQAVTLIVAAFDSLHPERADYRCDGTDDQVEILAAIDALPTFGGKVLLLEGRFNISAEIEITQINTILQGMGHGTTINGCTKLYEVNGANLVTVIDLHSDNICLRDLAIHGNAAGNPTGAYGITIAGHDCSIENVASQYCKNAGLYFEGSAYAGYFKNIYAEHNGYANFVIQGFINTFVDCIACCEANVDGFRIRTPAACQNTFIGCFALSAKNGFILEDRSHENIFFGCVVRICNECGFLLKNTMENVINGCTVYNPSQEANNTYDGFRLETATNPALKNRIIDCTVKYVGDGVNTYRYGISEQDANQDYNYYKGNIIVDPATGGINIQGLHSIAYHQYSDLFMDVLAISANHVVNNQALGADPAVCVLAAQPDVPRTLSWTLTHPTLTAFTLDIVGVNAKGQTVTETFTQADGWNGETSNAFATVTSVTMHDMTGNAAADKIDIGITDVLGLSNIIYETGDVYKINKNGANVVVAAAQVSTTYATYDMSVIGLALNDDFTIWYRSNLNIIP